MAKKKQSVTSKAQAFQASTTKTAINHKNSSWWEKLIPPAILTIVTTIFYYPSLTYPFQFDDLANITKKFSIRFDNPLSRWYKSPRWMGDYLNRINYEMTGFNSISYRIFNLAIHISTGIMLFYLIINLCKFLNKKSFLNQNASLIAFITSALFLLHPVQTQAVSYTIQARLEGLATLFIITILFLFTKAFYVKSIISKICLISASCIIAFLSYGTKEIVIVIPFLVILIDWFFISNQEWKTFRKHIPAYGALGILFVIGTFRYLSFDLFKRVVTLQLTTGNNRGNILTSHAHDLITAGAFLTSSFKVILHYLTIYLWPFSLSVEYDWKLSESFFSADAFLPFLALVSIYSSVIYLAIKKKAGYFTFGLLWFLISIAPRSTVIPSPELIVDYKAYLASIGWLFIFAVVLTHAIKYLQKNIKNLPAILKQYQGQTAIVTLFAIALGAATYSRNLVWATPVTFWEDIVVKAPTKARAHNNLGVALSEANQIDRAIEHYQTAISLDKFYSDPLSNIAVAFSLKGETDKAISALQKAIYIFPYYAEAYNNLGTLLIKQKKYDQAETALKNAISLRPYYGKAFHNMGRLYLEKKDETKAWEYFEKSTKGDLDTMEGFYTLGQLSLQLKRYDKAIQAYENAIKKGGGQHPLVIFNLANAYFLNKEYPKAENIYNQLLSQNPTEPKYLYNLGETYFSQEKFDQAAQLFKKVTTLPNSMPQAYLRISDCLEKTKKYDESKAYLNQLLASNAPEDFKKAVKNKLVNVEIQLKMAAGGGSINMRDIQSIMDKTGAFTVKHVDNKQAVVKKV